MIMIVATILVFIALLLVLVLAHELGHLLVAKAAGCRVEEFGFGFPPRLFSFTYGETRYSFNLLPIGGFVKIEGEDMGEEDPGPHSFGSKSASWRIAILAAGVTMNVLLAFVLLGWQAGIGFPVAVTSQNEHLLTDFKTYILEVVPASPAEQAGLKEFDRIVNIAGTENPTIDQVIAITGEHANAELALAIERQGQHMTIAVTPQTDPGANTTRVGISLAATGLQKVSWWQAPLAGIQRGWEMLQAIIGQFVLIIQRLAAGEPSDTLTGPIGIAIYTGEATRQGLSYVLEFAALISLNLAIINILPLPALDGGRIMFILMEKVFRRRFPGRIEQITHTVGFALLLLLMVVITFKDVQRFF